MLGYTFGGPFSHDMSTVELKSPVPSRTAMRENFRRKNKKPLTQTAEEYASHTSIHGVPYIFDRELSCFDRFLWLLVTLAFLGLSISLTWNTWTQWREEQVCIFVLHLCFNWNTWMQWRKEYVCLWSILQIVPRIAKWYFLSLLFK